jgi:hypothetical protein
MLKVVMGRAETCESRSAPTCHMLRDRIQPDVSAQKGGVL